MSRPDARAALGRRLLLATGAGWLAGVHGAAAAQAQPAAADPLTPAQRRWLSDHRPIRWLPERDYAPFVAAGADGRLRGLSVDILQRIATLLGLELLPMQPRPLNEQLALAARRYGDLITSLRATPERAGYLLFTRPYVSVPTVLVMRRAPGAPAALRPIDLGALARRSVAVGSGFAVEATVRAAWPEVLWRGVPSDLDGLQGVAAGRFDAAVVDAASGGYLMAQPGLGELVAVADVGFRYELCFAVRSDWPVLRDVLDQGVAMLPRADLAALRQQWLESPADAAAPSRTPLATGIGAALVAAGGLGAAAVAWQGRRRAAAAEGGEPGP